MANPYYTASGNPGTSAPGLSSPIRAEFTALVAAFDKLPALTANANRMVLVNSGSTALTVGATWALGAFDYIFTGTGSANLTLPGANATLVGRDTTDTLSNKTMDTGTIAVTQLAGDSSVKLATTAFVAAAVAAAVATAVASFVPLGVCLPHTAGAAAPNANWLLPFGQAVSRTTYSALFALYNAMSPALPYGVGDGSTTFNLPDMRDRVLIGRGNMGGADAGLITVGGCGIDGTVIGAAGGVQNEASTYSASVTGAHTTGTVGLSGVSSAESASVGVTGGGATVVALQNHTHNAGSFQTSGDFTVVGGGVSGTTSTVSNVQPSFVLPFIVRVL